MNALTLFRFESREVRILVDEHGEPWFVAADVARALEYRMASDASRIVDDEDQRLMLVQTPGGGQQMTCINEPGLYSLVFRSVKPSAKNFKRWVYREVLPAIRRTGSFHGAPQPLDPSGTVAVSNAHVYFVQQGDDGPVKIGRSANVLKRIEALQTSSPQTLRLLGAALEHGEFTEAGLHIRFSHLRISGEWFRPEPELLSIIPRSV